MTNRAFVHLHVHTEYSLLDGLSDIPKLVKRARVLDMPALAITDHGTMFGVIDFYREAKKQEVKPIIGLEGYVAPRRMTDRDPKLDRRSFHMLLLARNMTGYKNLLKIASAGQLEGFYNRPRVDREFLEQHADGLIATSGCIAAMIPQMILDGREEEARDLLDWHLQVFGKDHFFIELQQHDIRELETINRWLIDIGRRDDIRFVATNDVHYVLKEDYDPHDTLLCIQSSALKTDADRLRMSDNSYYLADVEEMWSAFGHINDGEPLRNTLLIAEMCEPLKLERERYHLPVFPVPEGFDAQTFLRHLCEIGLRWRYGARAEEAELRARLDRELEIIHDMGFDTYFLIVWDLCEFARAADIWWNVRGSGAGSVAAYCLGITNIDPVQNNLLFERFLNPGRVSMPDIDLDYPDDRREEMIRYVVQKYGEDKVAAIITFGTLGAKAAVRDVGRVLGMDLSKVNAAARLIPTEPKPKPIQTYIDDNPELRQMVETDAELQAVMKTASALQGVSRHASTHAAGVIISDLPLVEYIPLHRQTKGGDDSASAIKQVTQFPMEKCEELGLLKVDFLGLSTLTIMRRASDLIRKNHGIELTMDNIPYRPTGDPEIDQKLKETFELIGRGETIGVFQVESSGMQAMLRDMRPTKFEHIVAAVSLYRPGPMDYIPTFNRRMHGEEPVVYHHPKLEPILAETYGICVYQEQIMQIAGAMFGYSLGDADLMRRAVSKKKKEDLQKHREIFLTRGPELDPTVTPEIAGKIFDDIEFFANYGFNKCLTRETRVIDADTGAFVTLGDLIDGKAAITHTLSLDRETLQLTRGRVSAIHDNGIKPVYRLRTRGGRTIRATDNHPFLTGDGWTLLRALRPGTLIASTQHNPVEGQSTRPRHQLVALGHPLAEGDRPQTTGVRCGTGDRAHHDDSIAHVGQQWTVVSERAAAAVGEFSRTEAYAGRDGFHRRTIAGLADAFESEAPRRLAHSAVYWDEVVSIEYDGDEPTVDLTVEGYHNFVANDLIVHNSHAADYAVITVQSAYMKTHYAPEYMAALLSVYFDDKTKVTTLLGECKRLEIPILPPDINSSSLDFDIQRSEGRAAIRFGMAAIKNVGIGAIQHILEERAAGGPFRDLNDLCARVDLRAVGKRALECLIKVGAFDSLNAGSRPQLLAAIDRIISHSVEQHKARQQGQKGLFGDITLDADDLLRNLPQTDPVSARDILNWERELLGIFVSSHPIDPVMDALKNTNIRSSHELKDIEHHDLSGQDVRFVGMVAGVRKMPTKNKEMMGIVTLEDRFGTIDAVLFPRRWRQFEELITDGAVIVVIGKLDTSRGEAQIIVEDVTTRIESLVMDADPVADEPFTEPTWLADAPDISDESAEVVPAFTASSMPDAETASGAARSHKGVVTVIDYGAALLTAHDGSPLSADADDAFIDGDFSPAAPMPQCVDIRLEWDGDEAKLERRMRRIDGILTYHAGQDTFQITLVWDGGTHVYPFPGRTTHACASLKAELERIPGVIAVCFHPL